MKPRIYIAADPQCMTSEKIRKDKLGGSERFCWMWQRYLDMDGLHSDMTPDPPQGEYDLAIHSNMYNRHVKAKKHILWAGSWHAQGVEHVDKVICVSQYFAEKKGWDNADIVAPPFDHKIMLYKSAPYPRRIVTHSNPNRHFKHTLKIAAQLVDRGVEFDWVLTGGNKLYSDNFGEAADFNVPTLNITHAGVMERFDLIKLLSSAEIWAYPNLSDESETFGVAPIEAAALEIPVILPDRPPFRNGRYLWGAKRCANEDEFANTIAAYLERPWRWKDAPVNQYRDDVIFPMLNRIVKNMLEGK